MVLHKLRDKSLFECVSGLSGNFSLDKSPRQRSRLLTQLACSAPCLSVSSLDMFFQQEDGLLLLLQLLLQGGDLLLLLQQLFLQTIIALLQGLAEDLWGGEQWVSEPGAWHTIILVFASPLQALIWSWILKIMIYLCASWLYILSKMSRVCFIWNFLKHFFIITFYVI